MNSGVHVHILHNPKAGEQDNTKKELTRLFEPLGFSVDYASVKERGWQRFKHNTSLLLIVGGDGTIRAVAEKILNRKLLDKRLPILLLPAGTANNFALTLGISNVTSDLPERLQQKRLRTIDVGTIRRLGKASFFLEGMGYGLFPALIKVMKQAHVSTETREEELKIARDRLEEIARTHEAFFAEITIDGQVYQDNFLLVEILNTQSIGPNLRLAPRADPSDGILHVALLRAEKRSEFLTYLRKYRMGQQTGSLPWELVELKDELKMRSASEFIHVDDKIITVKKNQLFRVGIRRGVLDLVL